MATGRKTGGRDFQPGHNLSKGRPKLPAWVKDARRLTTESFLTCLHDLHDVSEDDLKEIANDSTLPMKSIIMASWLLEAKLNDRPRQTLFDRLFGKVAENINHSIKDQLQRLSDRELIQKIKTEGLPLLDGTDDAD